jgi:hypothetical protein
MSRCLVLFSGTGSIEKVFKNNHCDCRGVDIDNKFNPYYHVDILKWDYKSDLKNWIPDYLHSSFVCCEFSGSKNTKKYDRNLNFGYQLIDKTIEIIKYVQSLNSGLRFTMENPKTRYTLEYEPLQKFNHCITSYCKYGNLNKKPTVFWYGGFDLQLKPICRNTKKDTSSWCRGKKNNHGVHKVTMAYHPKKNQIIDWKYFGALRKCHPAKYKGYKDTHFRYRIPRLLVKDIYNCVCDDSFYDYKWGKEHRKKLEIVLLQLKCNNILKGIYTFI